MFDRSARTAAEISGRQSACDLQLAESRHRAANMLASIAGLIRREIRSSSHPQQSLPRLAAQVEAFAVLHTMLSRRGAAEAVRIDHFLAQFGPALQAALLDPIGARLSIEADEAEMSARQIQALGLVAVELVINAAKHAFPGIANAEVALQSGVDCNGNAHLIVEDNGAGFDPTLPSTREGLGLAGALVGAARGNLSVESSPSGTRFTVVLPVR